MALMKSGPDYEYDEPQMSRKTIELMWSEFGNCCIDDNDRIDSSWCGWEFGTDRFEIWHWFDAQYAQWGGVHALMFPSEHKKSKYGEVMAEVNLQWWVNDYIFPLETISFDCAKALDMLSLEFVKTLVPGRAGYDTDDVFRNAIAAGLVNEHNGPFDCYICDQVELDEYIKAREKAEKEEA